MTSNHLQLMLLYCTSQHSAASSLFNGSTCISYRSSQSDIGKCGRYTLLYINGYHLPIRKKNLDVLSLCAESRTGPIAGRSAFTSGVAVDGALSIDGRSGETVEWQRWAGHHDDLWASSGNAIGRIHVGVCRIFLDDSRRGASIYCGLWGILAIFVAYYWNRNVRKIYHASIKKVYVDYTVYTCIVRLEVGPNWLIKGFTINYCWWSGGRPYTYCGR